MTTRPYLKPEELTETEREKRIVELLAIASVRMAREQVASGLVAPLNPTENAGTPPIQPSP